MESSAQTPNNGPIVTSEVLAMVKSGKTRLEIKEHYGLTHAQVTALFQSPSLKGRRIGAAGGIQILDDLSGATEPTVLITGATTPVAASVTGSQNAANVAPQAAPVAAHTPVPSTPSEPEVLEAPAPEAPLAEWQAPEETQVDPAALAPEVPVPAEEVVETPEVEEVAQDTRPPFERD